jgi:hypothetical protein
MGPGAGARDELGERGGDVGGDVGIGVLVDGDACGGVGDADHDEAARRAKSGRQPFRFDGLLYTNNSIFGVVRGNQRHKSAMWGTMILRGGIVGSDLGLLITDNGDPNGTGLRLYYDKRVDAFLNVEDPTQVQFARLVYQYL